MDDLNDEFIGPLNDSLATAGSTAKLDEVDGGIGFGGGIRQSGTNLLFALDYEHLTAKSDVTEDGVTFEVRRRSGERGHGHPHLSARLDVVGPLRFRGRARLLQLGRNPLAQRRLELARGRRGRSGIGYHAGALDAALGSVYLNIFAGWPWRRPPISRSTTSRC